MIKYPLLAAMMACATTILVPAAFGDGQSGAKLDAAFKKADSDNDGTLTRAEAKAMPRVAKNFAAIDTDNDGTVSLDEIRAAAMKAGNAMHERAVQRFKATDKDNDGTLTKDEAKSMPRVAKHFDAIDQDKDGTVSEQEIHDYMKTQHSKK